MFIITAKCSKRRVVKILLIFALLLSLFLALRACRHSSPPPVIAAGTNEERIAYLASLGWEVNDQPIETLSVTLGETLEDCYLQFNRKEDAKNMKLAPGVFFTHEKEASFTGDKLPLSDAFFAGGVRAYDDLKSDAVTIRSTKSEKTLTISAPGFPYWGFWMPEKGGAPFLCLEPWYGHADYADFDGEFAEKAGTQKLAPGKTFHAEYTITVG